jgi:3-hydroxymyristoyl/3-hydroxydecanoyl-(acyl carrier protein) dehydratase
MTERSRLPHAYPFRLIAREGGSLGFAVTTSDAWSRGAGVPQWVIVEMMTQAAGLIAGSEGSVGGVLVQVARFLCPRPVMPGDRLDLTGEVVHRMGPVLRVKMTARRKGRLVARGTFTIREIER